MKKYINNPNNQDIINRITNFIRIFINRPEYLASSSILNNRNFLKKFFESNKKISDEFNTFYEKFWKDASHIYKKFLNKENITEEEKSLLMTYFIQYMNYGCSRNKSDPQLDAAIKNYADKLLRINKVPTNKEEKLFIFNYASRFVLNNEGYKDSYCNIRLFYSPASSDGSYTGGYNILKSNFIAINTLNSKSSPLDEKLQMVCHETEHYIQNRKMYEDPQSSIGLKMLIHSRIISQRGDYHRGHNYLFSEIEEDANRMGYYYTRLLYVMADAKQIREEISKKEKKWKLGRKFHAAYYAISSKNGRQIAKYIDTYNVFLLQSLVISDLKILNEFPVLKELFTDKGEYRSLKELLSKDFVSHDLLDIQNDLFCHLIRNGDLEKMDLHNASNRDLKNIYHRLCTILNSEVSILDDFLEDERCNDIKKYIFDGRLTLINNICNFLNSSPYFSKAYMQYDDYSYFDNNIRRIYYLLYSQSAEETDYYKKIKSNRINYQGEADKYKGNFKLHLEFVKNSYIDKKISHIDGNIRKTLIGNVSLEQILKRELSSSCILYNQSFYCKKDGKFFDVGKYRDYLIEYYLGKKMSRGRK